MGGQRNGNGQFLTICLVVILSEIVITSLFTLEFCSEDIQSQVIEALREPPELIQPTHIVSVRYLDA